MAMKNKTRRALVLSVLSLILCCSMLVGTTFAWFTDSVTNGVNSIKSGNLDIELYHCAQKDAMGGIWYDETKGAPVAADTKLFLNVDGEPILWEPEAAAIETFCVENKGSLALKYELRLRSFNVTKTAAGKDLTDALVVTGYKWKPVEGSIHQEEMDKKEDIPFGDGFVLEGTLLPKEKHYFTMMVGWPQTANDNEFNVPGGLSMDLGVELVATQYTYEKDVFGNGYDTDATFDAVDTFVAAGEDKAANNAALKAAIAAGDQDGDGKAIIQLGAGEYDADLYVVDTAKNLTINGQGADTKLNFKNGQVRLELVDSLTINNCTIGRMVDKKWGQLVFGSSTVAGGNYTISNCIFEGASTQGIYINQNVPATFNIKNCTFNGDFGSEGAITVQNNDGVDITVNVTGCDFKNIPSTSHEIYMLYAYNGWTLNAEGVNAYWKTNP